MQVTFENTFEHWLNAQLFIAEQLSSLKKYDRKGLIKLIVCLIVLDGVALYANGLNTFFWFFTLFLSVFLLNVLFQHSILKKKIIYQRLNIAFAPDFEQEKDKTVVWDITPEQMIIRNIDRETRYRWTGVRKFAICPEYLFVYFGIGGWAYLPRQAVAASEYQPFCDALIRTCQEHAGRQEKPAEIVQSDWTLNLHNLKKRSAKTSVKKIVLTVIWATLFLMTGMVFMGLIVFALDLFIQSCFDTSVETGTASEVLSSVWLTGSLLFLVSGSLLSLFEKLPGTKPRPK